MVWYGNNVSCLPQKILVGTLISLQIEFKETSSIVLILSLTRLIGSSSLKIFPYQSRFFIALFIMYSLTKLGNLGFL